MATVRLWGGLADATGGVTEVELRAETIRELFRLLAERFPALEPRIEEGLAVSIDGDIYRDSWQQPLPPNAEVYVMPRIAGG